MAFVNGMRFNRNHGAIVSDEDLWNERFRRRLACDNMHPLLSPELSEALKLYVVYGGAGYPPLHKDVVDNVRVILEEKLSSGKSKKNPSHTVAEVAEITLEVLRDIIRKRIDQRLLLHYGFNTDDLNRGWYEYNGERIDINQEKVKEAAHKISTGSASDRIFSMLMSTRAMIAGWDPIEGFDMHVLETAPSVKAWIQDGVDTIGAGKYGSAISLARYLNNKPLPERLAGPNPPEGLFELLLSALTASDHFQQAGGNINIVLINSEAKKGEKYREIFDDRARLAGNAVRAAHAGLISRDKAIELLQTIVFEDISLENAWKKLEDAVPDNTALDLLLRGYKLHDVMKLSEGMKSKSSKKVRSSSVKNAGSANGRSRSTKGGRK